MALIAKQLYNEQLEYINEKLKQNDKFKNRDTYIIQEISVGLNAKDILQFVIAGAAEYGLDVTVVGAPASLAADTVVDALFTETDILSGIAELNNLEDQFGRAKNLMQAVFNSRQVLTQGFSAFYNHVRSIWSNIQRFFPNQIGNLREFVRELKEELSVVFERVARRITDLVGQGIKLVIPDATVGVGVSTGIKTLLVNLAENAYTVLTALIGRSETLTQFITNPSSAQAFFERMYDGLIQVLNQAKTKTSGWNIGRGLATGAAAGLATGGVAAIPAALAGATPMGGRAMRQGIKWLINKLTQKRSLFLNIINQIFAVLIPTLFGLLASYQILMKDDFSVNIRNLAGQAITRAGTEVARELTGTSSDRSEAQSTIQEISYTPERFKLLAGMHRNRLKTKSIL